MGLQILFGWFEIAGLTLEIDVFETTTWGYNLNGLICTYIKPNKITYMVFVFYFHSPPSLRVGSSE